MPAQNKPLLTSNISIICDLRQRMDYVMLPHLRAPHIQGGEEADPPGGEQYAEGECIDFIYDPKK